MTSRIIIFLFLVSASSNAQSSHIDCSKLLDKQPFFLTHNVAVSSRDSFLKDLEILRVCGNMDSIDLEMFSGPVLGQLLMQTMQTDSEITYRVIFNKINDYRATEDYATIREIIGISKRLENKIASVDVFESDKPLLLKVGIPATELEDFKKFIAAHSSEKMTYSQAFRSYNEFKYPAQAETKTIEKIKFEELEDVSKAIKAGKKSGKRVLLYFTCHACVNARKMEDYVLTDEKVKSILTENFVCYNCYVDDGRPDKASGLTIGEKFMKLQYDNFKADTQPYFCIIDEQGHLVSEIKYTRSPEDFIDFLNMGLK